MFDAARQRLETALAERAFPAVAVEVGTATHVLWSWAGGRLTFDEAAPPAREDTIFDLASLTKVLLTTPLLMQRVEQGTIDIDDPVALHVHEWRGPDREGVTIGDLLAHCSGLPGHRDYYETLSGPASFVTAICAEPLEYAPRTQSVYSDLGFILLGVVLAPDGDLQRLTAKLAAQMAVADPLQFTPPETWRPRIAPTALEAWRGRLLVGEVDDSNAAALGGQAGHAGLFGTASAVGSCARHLLQVLHGRVGAFAPETARRFVVRRGDIPGSSRALGWDTMLPTSSCGTRMSARAFGHTGFTGTSLWIDPEANVYVALLTNRVHPDRQNTAIQAVRRDVHDAVMSALPRVRSSGQLG